MFYPVYFRYHKIIKALIEIDRIIGEIDEIVGGRDFID